MPNNSSSQELFRLDGDDYTILRDREKAILVRIIGGDEIWLPKSQLESFDEKEIVMKAWIAKEKGLI